MLRCGYIHCEPASDRVRTLSALTVFVEVVVTVFAKLDVTVVVRVICAVCVCSCVKKQEQALSTWSVTLGLAGHDRSRATRNAAAVVGEEDMDVPVMKPPAVALALGACASAARLEVHVADVGVGVK